VSQAITNTPADIGEVVFPASDYVLGIVQRIVSSGVNTRIALSGKGEVSIFPARREYSSNIPDAAEFFQAPSSQFEFSPLSASAPQGGRRIDELLWEAAFHASQGRLIEGTSKFDVVTFRHWPNLPKLSKTPNTARLCALLTRHPMTIMLVHRQLGITKEEVYRIYSAAFSSGIANIVNQNPQAVAPAVDEPEEAVQKTGLFRSMFTKISGL
jgi:hypothetical protein